MNKKNLKKNIFPLITGRNRFCFRNESVSSPLNPMVLVIVELSYPVQNAATDETLFNPHFPDVRLKSPSNV